MADNVIIPASGTGDATPTIAADDVGGAKYQRVKISVGADGVVGDATPANPIPVADAPTEAGVGGIGDVAWVSGNGSIISVLKGIFGKLPALVSGRIPVDGSGVTQPVSDAAGSLTVDAPAATPVAVRFSDGATLQTPVRVDNNPFVDNSSNVTPVAFIFDESAGTALTEDDAAAARIDSKRAQIGVIEDATTRGQRLAVTAANAAKVDGSAVTQPVSVANPVQAATGTLANVAASASSVTLQASNANRKGLVIVNDSTSILYVKFGSSASTTSFTYFLAGSVGGVPATLELPPVTYTGIVTGIWASAVGNARVTELT